MKKGYIIAIDGPSGAGKSTVSQRVAKKLGYLYLDTGAMYRACALKAIQLGMDLDNLGCAEKLAQNLEIELRKNNDQLQVLLDGKEVSREIRTPEMGMNASKISQHLPVRKKLWELQRKMAEKGGIVAEGRDMATVVFPDADFKFYLTASPEVRAKRRYQELLEKGHQVNFEEILKEVRNRDEQDSKRKLAPLKKADDAIEIDTSGLNIDQVVDKIIGKITEQDIQE